MIDVVLYGYNGRGDLVLKEQLFPSLHDLSLFFGSRDGSRWRWAEVETAAADGKRNVTHYTAESLNEMLIGLSSDQNPG